MNFWHTYILPRFLNAAMEREDMRKEREGVVEKASGVVLEIGFGSGLNIPFYKNVAKLYAVDPSRELYDLAKERIASASFPSEYIQASAEKIPLADKSIDTVVSTWSLCSIPHPAAALKEVARVLKPEGKFIFIEHGKSPKQSIAKWQTRCTPFSKKICGGCHFDREIDKLIRTAGFEIVSLETFTQKGKPMAYMYKGEARVARSSFIS